MFSSVCYTFNHPFYKEAAAMLEKMIRTQTAQKEKQLDDWMQRHDAAHPFPSETVELTPDLAYAPE